MSQVLWLAVWGNPAVLWWLAAASAPLVVHLLSRRKYQDVNWAAMRFLQAAWEKNRRRVRMENWLLLLLRTLAILFVVLAAAQPGCEPSHQFVGGGQSTHRILVLDASYSMAYRPGDRSRFEIARSLAEQVIADSPLGDGFSLVLLAAPPRVIVGAPSLEPAAVLDELADAELLHGGGDLPATLRELHSLLELARREQPRLTRHEIYFLTDLGRTTWAPAAWGAGAEETVDLFEQLAQRSALTLLDVGQPSSANLAVTRLTLADSFATPARPVRLEAVIANFSSLPRNAQAVEWFVDGRQVGRSVVDLPPEGSATAVFTHQFDAAGEHAVEVRLAADVLAAGDLLDLDNRRYLSAPVQERIEVLCIDGKPGGEFQAAGDYLTAALQARRSVAEESIVRVDRAPGSALLERDLRAYDVLVLANVSRFTPREAEALAAAVRRGTGLLLLLGDKVQADSYNESLLPLDLLPARLLEAASGEEQTLDPLDYRHPIVSVFRGQEQAGLLTTPVFRYFRSAAAGDDVETADAQVVLAFSQGDPLIVARPCGAGRVVLVTTAVDAATEPLWSSMPVWPSFVPLIQEMLAYVVRNETGARNLLAGQPLRGELPPAADAALTLFLPSGEETVVRAAPEGDLLAWTSDGVWQTGFVRVQSAAATDAQIIAVNLEASESDLACLAGDELTREILSGVPLTYESSWSGLAAESTAEPLARRSGLHRYLLCGALLLLLADSVLAGLWSRRLA